MMNVVNISVNNLFKLIVSHFNSSFLTTENVFISAFPFPLSFSRFENITMPPLPLLCRCGQCHGCFNIASLWSIYPNNRLCHILIFFLVVVVLPHSVILLMLIVAIV